MNKSTNTMAKVLFFLLLAVAGTAKAQVKQEGELIWPQADAKWSYCLIGQNGEPFDKETWGVKGDSLIDGKRYDIIGLLDEKKASIKPDLLTRCHNDTVFRYVNNKEYPYFKFDMEIGDVFTTFRSAGWMNSWNDSTCSSVLPLRVIEKETLNINDVELNRYLLADTLFSYLYGVDDTPVYELVDRIGVINAYPFINNAEGTDCFISTDFLSVEVFKYEDKTHTFLFSECDITAVSEHPLEGSIEVFPNPVSETVHIEGVEADEVMVYNALGQMVKTVLGTNEIDLSGLVDGVYMLRIRDKEGRIFLEKVMVR